MWHIETIFFAIILIPIAALVMLHLVVAIHGILTQPPWQSATGVLEEAALHTMMTFNRSFPFVTNFTSTTSHIGVIKRFALVRRLHAATFVNYAQSDIGLVSIIIRAILKTNLDSRNQTENEFHRPSRW